MIIIPDIHGRDFWNVPAVINHSGKEHILFLGDYLDPYPYEGINTALAFDNLLDIVQLKKEYPDKVTLLLGNHDLHYLHEPLFGGRFDHDHALRNREFFEKNAGLFQMTYETELGGKKYLFSHAGVQREWPLNNLKFLGVYTPEQVPSLLNDLWRDPARRRTLFAVLSDIPYSRWGDSLYGSPVWNDVDDLDDSSAEFEGVYQIFGHTQQEVDPVIKEHYACLDCRRPFRLDDDGVLHDIMAEVAARAKRVQELIDKEPPADMTEEEVNELAVAECKAYRHEKAEKEINS